MPIIVYDLRDGFETVSGYVIETKAGRKKLLGERRRVVSVFLDTGYEVCIDEDDMKKICAAWMGVKG